MEICFFFRRKLYKWLAQYLESSGDMDDALQYYTMANDYLARVRIHCFCEEFDRASELCDETGDKAASYHLARQFDNSDEINKAIHYFSRAQAYSNAIRLAKVLGLIYFNLPTIPVPGTPF